MPSIIFLLLPPLCKGAEKCSYYKFVTSTTPLLVLALPHTNKYVLLPSMSTSRTGDRCIHTVDQVSAPHFRQVEQLDSLWALIFNSIKDFDLCTRPEECYYHAPVVSLGQ